MKFKNAVLLPVLVLLELCVNVKSMRCYQCRSDVHSYCDRDLRASYLTECILHNNYTNPRQIIEGDAIYCRKTVQKLHFLKNDKVLTIRECATVHSGRQCYDFLSSDAVVQSCDCEDEGCNAGWRVEGARNCVFLIVTLLIVRFFPP